MYLKQADIQLFCERNVNMKNDGAILCNDI